MRFRTVGCAAAVVAVALAVAPVASGHGPMISAGFDAFTPPRIEALTGDTVMWANDSARPHDVVADGGAFDSGRLAVGAAFDQRFASAGAIAYHCSLHPSMTGEVDVYDLLLDHPAAPAGAQRPYPVHGRSALPSGTPVTIEADAGAGFEPVASSVVGDDGTFAVSVVPSATATLRAVAGVSASPAVQLVVLDHSISTSISRLRGHRLRIDATVTPAAPGAKVVLQLRLRERFGWWPVRTLRLDAASHARFVINRRARVPARVALTLPDGATLLATSSNKRV